MTMAWPQRIVQQGAAFFVPNLAMGGAERSMVDLANLFARAGVPVHLLVGESRGAYQERIDPSVALVDLHSPRIAASMAPLVRYLRRHKPAVLISALDHTNVVALLAVRLAGAPVKAIPTLRTTFSEIHRDSAGRQSQILPYLMRLLYPTASAVVAVSQGVADDYAAEIGVPRPKLHVIYNPVVNARLLEAAQAPLEHPWFRAGEPPVLLSVGRLTALKDFPTLLQAFARVRQTRPCRLLILGDGELRQELEELARKLDLGDDFALPGFAANPYAYMARSAVYVLSSVAEGLPGALIEALACGVPAVATDCPNGPREVLADGRFGTLVPVRNPEALAKAIVSVLHSPLERSVLQERAQLFSEQNALAQYQKLLAAIV